MSTSSAFPATFTTVTPVLEFHVGSQRSFGDWRVQLDELERTCAGDGRYAVFADADEVAVDVWVTWTKSEALWHIPRLSREGADLAFGPVTRRRCATPYCRPVTWCGAPGSPWTSTSTGFRGSRAAARLCSRWSSV
jgi:hypothetical protein